MKKIFYLVFACILLSKGATAQTAKETTQINITNLTVYAKESKLFVDWTVESAAQVNYFEVQRSTDGIQFTTVALVLGPDPRQGGDKFLYMEKVKDPKMVNAYYRLRHVGIDGKEQISKPVQATK
jgi:hypothetical protein